MSWSSTNQQQAAIKPSLPKTPTGLSATLVVAHLYPEGGVRGCKDPGDKKLRDPDLEPARGRIPA